ncbi:hypothetical protein NOF55_11065 [Rhizobiaceae bacterium BDR2-2]|uniref:Uncharacterized protein n=1 Tax=Ectorhizobium quercum TaxID=2965071 RepID=A0AAE3SVG8_9HYPH|nr:hypothetical protein [Ectorhizobium quercum]MCX8997643.1 hypothetical protein [Ectorhizobium quercum]
MAPFLILKLVAFLTFLVAFDALRAVARPGAYKGFTLREQLWLLWHVDHEGRQAYLKFVIATVVYFGIPLGPDGFSR